MTDPDPGVQETSGNAETAAPPHRPWWRRVFSAQESGLVLVILLVMAALTVFGGTKSQRETLALPEGAQVVYVDDEGLEHEPGAVPLPRVRDIVVIHEGERTRYSARPDETHDGWRLGARADGAPVLRRTVEVNKFLNRENLVLVAKDASFIAIMAVGMTAVIILAGIDLSVGSIYALAAIVGAIALSNIPPDAGLAASLSVGVLVTVTVGALCGLANGAMVVGLRVHPFVITLGMMAALRGLAMVIPQQTLGTSSIGGFPGSFTSGFFRFDIAGVQPVPVLVMLAVALAGWFVLSRTVLGRRTFAIGGNETAARYAGVPVGRVKIIVFTITGALAGLSACVYIGYYGAAETSAGTAYELQVIAAAVIGGASLMGGRGSALGAVLGAILIELINNAIIILEIDQSYNRIVMGAAIIVAVVIDQTKRSLSRARA